MTAPTYQVRAGFKTATWTEIGSTYSSGAQIAEGFWKWSELAAGPIPDQDVLEITAQRDAATVFDQLKTGKATIRLDNSQGDYSPDGGGTTLAMNQVVTVKAITTAGSVYGIFSGFIDKFEIEPDPMKSETRIRATDGADRLKRTINTDIQQSIEAGSLAALVLSATMIEDVPVAVSTNMTDSIPFSYLDDIAGGEALDKVLKSGGHAARLNGLGVLDVKDRNYDLALSPVASYNAFFGMTYALASDGVYNDVRLSGDPRKASVTTSVAELTDTPTVPASATVTFALSFQDPDTGDDVPVQSLATLVSSTDWMLNSAADGSGTDVTASGSISLVKHAKTADITVFNGTGNDAFVTKLVPRGTALLSRAKFTAMQVDSGSQVSYGRKTFEIENELIGTINFGNNYGEYLVAKYKDPLAGIGFSITNEFPAVVQTDLLDRVHVTNSLLGVGSAFSVRNVSHAISFQVPGLRHTVNYGVELSDTKDFFVLDVSQLDIGKLGF